MAKSRHNPPPPENSPRGMLAILAIGALLVAGLVVWALTRTVETDVPFNKAALDYSVVFSTPGFASGSAFA